MRAQEYVQLHALLWCLRGHLEARLDVGDAFEAYDDQPARPSHVHRSKEDHRRAIELLLDGFEDAIGDRPREVTTATA